MPLGCIGKQWKSTAFPIKRLLALGLLSGNSWVRELTYWYYSGKAVLWHICKIDESLPRNLHGRQRFQMPPFFFPIKSLGILGTVVFRTIAGIAARTTAAHQMPAHSLASLWPKSCGSWEEEEDRGKVNRSVLQADRAPPSKLLPLTAGHWIRILHPAGRIHENRKLFASIVWSKEKWNVCVWVCLSLVFIEVSWRAILCMLCSLVSLAWMWSLLLLPASKLCCCILHPL